PYFVMSCPATVEETSVPNTIGRLIQPATVGDLPSESWKYWDRKTVLPNIATPTRALASVASATVRLRKILSGMIGSAARASTRIASASSTTPAMTIVALQPDAQANVLPASDDQISSTETPAVISTAPSQSIRTSRRTTGRLRVRWRRTIDRRVNGTPIRKHQRQPSQSVSTSTPPISGPAIVPRPKIAPKTPAYRPSSRGGIIAASTIVDRAIMPPAPTPCTTRLATSSSTFGVRPASREPTPKSASDSWVSAFLLYRSAILPHSGTVAVIASNSAVTIHV